MAGRTCAMGFEAFTYHGGALEVARRLAPDAPTPWIDLSTGINPYPYPVPDLAPEVWTRLPEPEGLARLEAVAAARYRASAASVVAGPGSQALIQALARLEPRSRASARSAPTYGGHADAFAAAGAPVEHAASLDAMDDLDVAIVVNPNNPDGRISRRADLLDLHARLARRGGMLIVDEAFADFGGADETLEPALPASGAVVLRSFGKAYGLAGLRLGFAIASPDIAGRLRAALGPWPVSGPAIAIGSRALADSDWLDATRARLAKDRARLDALLERAGFRILGGTPLFSLAGARTRARLSSACSRRAFSPALSRARPTGCGLAFQPERRRGDGSRWRSKGQSLPKHIWVPLGDARRLPSRAPRIKGAHARSRAPSLHDSLRGAVSADAEPGAARWRPGRGIPRGGRRDGAHRRDDLRADAARRASAGEGAALGERRTEPHPAAHRSPRRFRAGRGGDILRNRAGRGPPSGAARRGRSVDAPSCARAPHARLGAGAERRDPRGRR